MAARRTAPISNVQFEELRPKSEWKEENAANVLRIHLPDFRKEQLSITYVHSTRIIRVTGERQIAGTNRRARFNQTFAVPQNCDVNNIYAKFSEGFLTITLPKSNVTPSNINLPKPQPSTEKTSSQEAAAAATTTAASTLKPAIPTPPAPAIAQAVPRTAAEVKELKGAEETRKPEVPRAPSLREVLKDTKPEKGQEEQATSRVPVPSPPPPQDSSSSKIVEDIVKQKEDTERKEVEEFGKKRKESSSSAPSPSKVAPPAGDTEGVKKRKEYSSSPGTITKEDDKRKSDYGKAEVVGEKMKEVKSMVAAAKETVKGRLTMEMGEDRQRLVKVGVAVLVIAAVGAYLYYSHRPSSSSPGNYGQKE